MRRAGQVLFCAGALNAGAALSWATEGSATASAAEPIGQFPPPMPPPEHFEVVRSTEAAPELTAHVRLQEQDPAPALEPEFPGPSLRPFAEPLRQGRVIGGSTPHRLILFTFDDGPDPRNTPRLLDLLDDRGVKAVFFLTASRIAEETPWARRNRAIAQDIVRRGHIVANHTMDHVQLPLLDDAAVLAQVQRADRVFQEVLGERTWLLRPPGGARSERVDALLAEAGYTQVLWNLGTGDFQVRKAEDVLTTFRRVLERREREVGDRGGVVLLHDTHAWSVDAVPMILDWIDSQNCELLARGEELYDVVGDPSFFFTPRGDADPSQAAPPATPDPFVLEQRQRSLRVDTRQRCGRLAAL